MLVIGAIVVGVSMARHRRPRRGRGRHRGERMEGTVHSLTQLVLTLVILPFQCLQAASAAVGYHDLRVNREGAAVEDLVRVFE